MQKKKPNTKAKHEARGPAKTAGDAPPPKAREEIKRSDSGGIKSSPTLESKADASTRARSGRKLKSILHEKGIKFRPDDCPGIPSELEQIIASMPLRGHMEYMRGNASVKRFAVAIENYRQIPLNCEGIKIGLGKRFGPGEITLTAVVGKSGLPTSSWDLAGDVSLIIPDVGLQSVMALSTTSTLLERNRFIEGRKTELLREMLNNAQQHGNEFPVRTSKLRLSCNRVRAIPAIPLDGSLYRMGNAGLFMTFEALSFSCEHGEATINFRGGTLRQFER